MDRRSFFKTIPALAVAIPALPAVLSEPAQEVIIIDSLTQMQAYVLASYNLGFTVSAQMLEDDFYGSTRIRMSKYITDPDQWYLIPKPESDHFEVYDAHD